MANLGYLQVVRRCNQQCLFCSNPANDRDLPVGEAKKLIDRYAKKKYDGVILTGGEPTLYEPLAELISYASGKGLACRIITNGQRTMDSAYLDSLLRAGLKHVHVSIHSHRKSVQSFLTGNPDSLGNILRSLILLRSIDDLGVDINQTICAQNADHVDETVRWLCERFPHLHHFSWTYLDTLLDRVEQHPEVVPSLAQSERSLLAAMRYLDASERTFRIEKLPLCYMGEFGHCSTETRAIVKKEERTIDFLDERKPYREHKWRYGKAPVCKKCSLDPICAGLWDMGGSYDPAELRPQTADPNAITGKILGRRKH